MSKHILITGCSSGFGALMAQSLFTQGHHVIATMRGLSDRNAAKAEALRNAAKALQQEVPAAGSLELLELDVTREDSVQQAVKAACGTHPHIDVVINNAGIGAGGLTEGFSPEQMQALFDVNVFGVQRVMQALLPAMRRRGEGLVINISSTSGRVVVPLCGPYTASKFALEALTETYRYELSGSGVEVCLVQPSVFATPFATKLQTAAQVPAGYPQVIAQQAQQMQQQIQQHASPTGPDPGMVAEAVKQLLAMPGGQRPLRTVVDPAGIQAFGVLNRVHAEVQTWCLQPYGYPPRFAY